MFDLHIYRDRTTLPLHFYYQAQSFIRIVWVDGDDYDIEREHQPPSTCIVIAKGKLLVSYAEVINTTLALSGQTYKCSGLSGVMTFPAFRKRGFGGQVVEAAGALMREDPEADVALLWTHDHNVPFYEAHGWEAMPNLITTAGDPSQPEVCNDEMRMMLFLSEKGRQARTDFEHARVYVGEGTW